MVKSLQDQLLNAGLVDEKKLKETQKQKRKQKKQKKGHVAVDEVKLRAQEAVKEKAERARQLNREKNAAAEKKAITAQIKQLINMNRIQCASGEISYQFTDGKLIKKIFVNEKLQAQLISGVIAIAKHGEGYAMVPKQVAEKIAQRDESFVIVINESSDDIDEDDPYADYKVPDDLMW